MFAPFDCTVSVPVFAPGGRPVGFAVTVTVVPPGGMVPEEGETVRYGLSVVAVNATSSAFALLGASMWTGMLTGVVLPSGAVASAERPVAGCCTCTVVPTTADNGPGEPLQLLA
jgi:hypothetical protein